MALPLGAVPTSGKNDGMDALSSSNDPQLQRWNSVYLKDPEKFG